MAEDPGRQRDYEPVRDWRESYMEEDSRWSRRAQVRDWLWLLLLMAIVSSYHLVVFLLEPGLR